MVVYLVAKLNLDLIVTLLGVIIDLSHPLEVPLEGHFHFVDLGLR